MSKIAEALTLAIKAHKGQKRKLSHAPYVVHIFDVVKFLMYADAPEHLIVAGALHDVLEDTSISEEDVERQFGSKVVKLVKFCTEPGNTPDSSDEHMLRTWKERKTHAIEAVRNASDEESLLKLADSLSNITSLTEDYFILGESMWDAFRGGKDGNTWYFWSLYKEFNGRFPDHKLCRLYERALEEVLPK